MTSAPWDTDLAPALRERGIAVFEETLWETLRDDLHPPRRLTLPAQEGR